MKQKIYTIRSRCLNIKVSSILPLLSYRSFLGRFRKIEIIIEKTTPNKLRQNKNIVQACPNCKFNQSCAPLEKCPRIKEPINTGAVKYPLYTKSRVEDFSSSNISSVSSSCLVKTIRAFNTFSLYK